ncbi:MAG: GDP-mannose 4,6-dehydratase [Candidatus Limnocylindria bacterium]
MRALVIGADGFAGRWLLRHLLESGDGVAAAVGPGYGDEALPENLDPLRLDVRDAGRVNRVVTSSQPDVIYFLAGVSRAGARDDLDLAMGISVQGALNTLAAAAALDAPVRLLHVGSSHVYAVPRNEAPIDERAPIRPAGIYGAAKAAAESALLYLGAATAVEVIAVRAFNHIGPGQQAGFVVPSLARQVSEIARGGQEPIIRAGNLDARRDFTDVRDVVRAYRLAVVHGAPGEAYNVASGRAISVRQVLAGLLELRSVRAEVDRAPELSRAGESTTAMIGDAGKLTALTGWRPEISIEQSLAGVLDSLGGPS